MNIFEAINNFGLPPHSKSLDAYLPTIGIDERPVYDSNPSESITKFDEGFSLIFESELGYME
jgi:hypothetical protein